MRKPDSAINSEFSRREAIILRVHGMASILQIPEKLIRKNSDILDDKKFELIISGSDDESISAGIIEFICRSNNLNLKTKKIAKKFEISENAVRKQSKKIAEVLNVKLEDKRKKRG
jgi:transcription initiation factor TFIIIB Brf1 subunit/transcription initiation factor TFIIB